MLKGKEVKVYDGDLIGWTTGIIKGAIARNGKAHGIKFINLTEDEYYKIKPITLIF